MLKDKVATVAPLKVFSVLFSLDKRQSWRLLENAAHVYVLFNLSSFCS